ncbi:unnamed protein product [Spirodela intermedia]|uniref:Cystatin domain-containing protein n=1 Tax=Spirodela intermedia TaxID=51605 RepID=A0A7I8KCG5_SPIIN|nr:unnamed protein product [Spirodela intermedia]CAA7395482.1 unnamed protein product [Spirodela intermedia]CAA7395483.1 unnamed protein product [Spirodela intermedia]CAA7395486.1 unnamed protein product [Spirodela intermedia]
MRTQLPSVLLLLALLSAVTLQSQAQKPAPYPPRTGEWTRIKKVDEYHVQGIARFAVSEHNKQTGEDLEYVRIYRGYVDGPFYKLLIQATDDVKARRYEAVVRDRLWNKPKELIYFRRSS